MPKESLSRDRKVVSNEPYEIEYIHSQFPKRSHAEVEKAIKDVKADLGGSEDREKIMTALRKKLG